MYERPDVPKDNPHRNAIAVGVLVAVAVALVVLVSTLWRLANANTALGDKNLANAVASAAVSSDAVSEAGAEYGYAASSDQITVVLFAITSDASDTTLTALRVAVLNETQAVAKLVEVPVSVPMQGDSATMAQYFSSGGAEGLVSALASVGRLSVSHVVVMSESGWNAFMTVAAQGSSALTSNATQLLEGIASSDMDTSELLDIAQRALSTGLSANSIEAVQSQEATDDAGNVYSYFLPSDLLILVGRLVPIA